MRKTKTHFQTVRPTYGTLLDYSYLYNGTVRVQRGIVNERVNIQCLTPPYTRERVLPN